jgi:hypothetical protein
MTNYLLRNLNVVLTSSNQDTNNVELIIEFDTLHFGVKPKTEIPSGDHLKFIYEIDEKLESPSLYHNGFIYEKVLNWNNNPLLTITVVVEYPKDSEAGAVTKSEKDVIKPSGGTGD